jgi:signal transduction histidine kinase
MLRRESSLQRTLAVRFSATMFVALLALAFWAYLGVRRTLLQELDRSLQGSGQLQVNSLAALRSAQGNREFPINCFVRDINRFVVLRDSTGLIVGSNSARARGLLLDPAAFQQARLGTAQLRTNEGRGGDYRSIYLAVPATNRSPAAVVQVAASLRPLQGSLRSILLGMLGTVALATLATALGAGWLARSAVAPVREITRQARAVTGDAAGQRITAHAGVTEFQGLTEVLNDMLGRLEQAAQWHRRIIRDLGHDLRTPVTAMRAGVEVALWGERTPEDYRRILASTLEEIDRLSLICDALVLLSRLQTGEVTMNLVALDARLLAREAVERAGGTASGHAITLQEAGQPIPIRADVRLMGMVLDQLLDNARRYTPPGSHIGLTVAGNESGALLVVEDNGSGLSDVVLPHLFEPFYRSDSARAREGGPGLGLTATAAIVALHGGKVRASRAAAGGLCVTITLPRTAVPLTAGVSRLPDRAGTSSIEPVASA